MANVVVPCIELGRWPGQQLASFFFETLSRRLLELAQCPLAGIAAQPLLQQLVQVRVAVEAAIALEEVVLHVAHHAFGLALGSGPLGPASPGGEAVMVRQFQKACVEDHAATTVMPNDGGFLVIHQDTFGHTAKIPEGLHQGLVGMLCVLAGSGPDMEVA
eukprot:TRINITY_DN16284_c0_g1_i1.p5 TRINITY_DN16284_c0_g1~~TRINITY_DN16284_c0_g1_i1.p5  ORF type:complete len:160 (-),score=13.03 TRINITY_DN16284_c0_g1_i1:631-1110(-)